MVMNSRIHNFFFSLLYPALAISLICSCSKVGIFGQHDDIEIKEVVVFQGGYINWAWGYQNWGWFIDRYGNVRTYDVKEHSDWWGVLDPDHIKRADLEHNYEQAKEILLKIPKAELLEKYALAMTVADGPFSEKKDTARDAGGGGFFFYVFNENEQTYRQVTLTVTGDVTYENLHPSAQKLIEWLNPIHDKYLKDRERRR